MGILSGRQSDEDRILIAIGHGSRMPAKRWFIERYKALCHRLVGYNGRIHLVLLGDKDDLDGGEYLKNGLDGCVINLAGVTSIIESAAILSRCALYIGNDTGIMHLAASMGVPAIGIFTARENPGRWEPYGEDNVVLRKEVDCAGCFLEECVEMRMKCLDMKSRAGFSSFYRIKVGDYRLGIVHRLAHTYNTVRLFYSRTQR